jgi:hypothetical protein
MMGLFDISNPATKVQIFDGPASIGATSTIELFADGSVWLNGSDTFVNLTANAFGFYITNPDNLNTFYGYNDALNPDGRRHVVTFYSQFGGNASNGQPVFPDSFLMAFEDKPESLGADFDYNDFIYNFQVVATPPPPVIPEPASMLLFGLGGLGALGLRARRSRKA